MSNNVVCTRSGCFALPGVYVQENPYVMFLDEYCAGFVVEAPHLQFIMQQQFTYIVMPQGVELIQLSLRH